MNVFNLYDDELTKEPPDPPGFCWQVARLGPFLGGSLLGWSVYALEPGESICPYHYEYPNEEWLLVVTGRPTLRDSEGEHELEAGDVVPFLPGPAGAHQVINRTAEPLRVVMLSTKDEPAVAVYPDSDKIGVWPGNPDDDLIVRRSDGVGYWEGESAS